MIIGDLISYFFRSEMKFMKIIKLAFRMMTLKYFILNFYIIYNISVYSN